MGQQRDTQGPEDSVLPHQRWLAELKRRRVLRVVAAYGAVAFLVMEVADLVFPAIPLPAWTVSLVVWLAILGLPFAVALAWVFEMTPEGIRRTDAAASDEIDAIVGAPLWQRWTAGVLALAGLTLLALGFLGGRTVSAGADSAAADPTVTEPATVAYADRGDDPRPAIAVLPFADLSPEGDQSYFSEGVSEEILTALVRIRELRVAGRSSGFAYRGTDLNLTEVGRELGVGYILGGSVRRSGDEVRIRTELVDASDGLTMWSESYDRQLVDIFEIQSEIAEAVAQELQVSLGFSRESLVTPTLDVEAHDLYLNARAAMRRRGPGVGEAIGLFEASIEQDPGWAPAWAGLAEARAVFPFYPGTGSESTDSSVWADNLAAAEEAARRALELDPQNASAHVALGGVHRDRWEWDDAERQLLRALELDPDNYEAHIQYAEVLWGTGRLDAALRQSARALALDRNPLSLDVHGFVLYMNDRMEEAEALLEEGIRLDASGEMHFLRTVLATLLLVDNRYREALDRFSAYLPDAATFERMGEALETGDPDLLPSGRTRGWAQVAVLLGEEERALDALEELVFALPFRVQYDIWDPTLRPLFSTQRFQEVILPRVRLSGVEPVYAQGPGGP